jgi:hypothetical protein
MGTAQVAFVVDVDVTGSGEPEIIHVIFPPTFKFPAKIQIFPLKFEFNLNS